MRDIFAPWCAQKERVFVCTVNRAKRNSKDQTNSTNYQPNEYGVEKKQYNKRNAFSSTDTTSPLNAREYVWVCACMHKPKVRPNAEKKNSKQMTHSQPKLN